MKKKILVIALAIAVMLMGAGYAYWTDQISVDSVVGTGEFDVNIVKVSDGGGDRNPGKATTNWEKYMKVDTDFVQGTPTKSLNATISNLYPGSVAHLSFDIENNGSLPAVLDSINVDYAAITGSAIVDEIYYRVDYKVVQDGVQVGTPKHYIDGVGLATFESKLNTLLSGITLEPGQMLIIGDPVDENGQDLENKYTFELPATVVNDDDCENNAFELSFQMNWKQHNDQGSYKVD